MHLSASNLGVDPWEPLGIFTDQHSQINLSAVYQKRLPLAPAPKATVGSDGTLGHKVQYFKVLPNCNKIFMLPCPGMSPGSPHSPPPPSSNRLGHGDWEMHTVTAAGITIFIREKPISGKKLSETASSNST